MQNLINIHFSAPDLARRMAEERPAMLYFVFNPRGVVVIVAHDLSRGDFVAQVFPQLCTAQQSDLLTHFSHGTLQLVAKLKYAPKKNEGAA